MRRFTGRALVCAAAVSLAGPAAPQALLLGVGAGPPGGGGGPPPAGATLNSADADGVIALSGADLTATANNSGSYGSVRSTTSHTSGKYCFQWTSTTASWEIGLMGGTDSLAGDAGSKANAYVWYAPASGQVYHAGSASGLPQVTNVSNAGFQSGATGRACFDFTAHLGWFFYSVDGRWNGNPSADPANGTGGFAITAGTYFAVFSDFNGGTATFNFASPTMPAGFSAW